MRLRGYKARIRFRAQPRIARDPRLPAATVAAASRNPLVGGFLVGGRLGRRITHVAIGTTLLQLHCGLRDRDRSIPVVMVMDGSGDGGRCKSCDRHGTQ